MVPLRRRRVRWLGRTSGNLGLLSGNLLRESSPEFLPRGTEHVAAHPALLVAEPITHGATCRTIAVTGVHKLPGKKTDHGVSESAWRQGKPPQQPTEQRSSRSPIVDSKRGAS